MNNAIGEPQTVVLLGGTSEIGLAIVRRLLSPSAQAVVLACRDTAAAKEAADELRGRGVEVHVVEFDAAKTDTHEAVIDGIAKEVGDLDVVILAFGVLGDQDQFSASPADAAAAVHVNYTGGVSAGLAVAKRLRAQGHGRLVVLSSVAGERARKANFVYGSSKAGLDAFAQGLGDDLAGSGAGVLVVRPGFVHSRMTDGMSAAPFATNPETVADAVAAGLRGRRRTVWVPGAIRYVFMVLRHLPGPVWRRLPLK